MNLKFNINGKMLVYVLGTALLIYLSTIGYIAFKLKNTSALNAMASYESLAFNESLNLSKKINYYTYWLNNTSTALSFLDEIKPKDRRDHANKLLTQFLVSESNIYGAGILWNEDLSIDSNDSIFVDQKGNLSNGKYAPYFNKSKNEVKLSETNSKSALNGTLATLSSNEGVSAILSTDKNTSVQFSKVIKADGEYIALLFIQVNLDYFTNKESLELFDNFIITDQGQIASSSIKLDTVLTWQGLAPNFDAKYQITQKIQSGTGFSQTDRLDYNNKAYYAVFTPLSIDQNHWSVGVLIPKSIISSESIQTFYIIAIIALLGLVLLSFVLFAISKSISNPLLKANNLLQKLVNGDLSQEKKRKALVQDEIGDISDNTNQLVEGLGSAAEFASQIGHGNLDVKYNLLSGNDMLGSALIKMQESLKEAKINEDLKKVEDEKRNWVTHGLAKFGEIIRDNNTDIEKFTSNVIKHLLEYIDAAQGAVYIHTQNEYEVDEAKTFELKAAMAYGKPIMLKHSVQIGQELVGRAAQENRILYLKDMPNSYATISPGMKSKSKPKFVLVSPMAINNDVFGIIELLSYHEFEAHQIEFVEKLSENIASVISSVNININTARLLEQSRHQADELAQHEEEMRQNLEEMQATQEEALKRQNKLTSHLDGLKSSLITAELDLQGRILHMSPSMSVQYHVSMDNIKGKFYEAIITDDESSRNKFNEFWNKLMEDESGKRIQNIEFRGKSYYYIESYQLIQKEGLAPKVLISVQNKTREKELTDELKKLTDN